MGKSKFFSTRTSYEHNVQDTFECKLECVLEERKIKYEEEK